MKMPKYDFVIGKAYKFGYESTSPKREGRATKKVAMTEELGMYIIKEIFANEKWIVKRAEEQLELANSIAKTKNPELKEKLKERFNELYRNFSEEKTPIQKASNFFIRAFKSENMIEGDDIEAIYAGRFVTVNGLVQDKWFVSKASVVEDYLTDDVMSYVESID